MRNILWVILLLIATLPVKLTYNFLEYENLVIIYAVGDHVFAKQYGRNNTVTDLGKFDGDVTGFSKYNGYLYVSAKRSWFFSKNSAIWRVKLDNSSSSGIDVRTWKKFHTLNAVYEDVLNLVVAKDYIYAGRSDGIMWRCSAEKSDSCEDFHKLDGEIFSINYNPVDNRTYAFEFYESYLSYFNSKEFFKRLWSCSADTAYSCDDKNLDLFFETGVRFFQFAFNGVWIISAKYDLLKCSYKKENGTFKLSSDTCLKFGRIGQYKHYDIVASNEFLYIHTHPGSDIWRCDPSVPRSCLKIFKAPAEKMGPYTVDSYTSASKKETTQVVFCSNTSPTP